MVKYQRVERDVAFDPTLVQRAHDIWQLHQCKTYFCPSRKMFESEIDGISTGFNSGVKLRIITDRAQNFRFNAHCLLVPELNR